jgi:hypothetical protein
VSLVKYELGLYIQEDILHSHRRGNLKSYIALTGCALLQRRNVFPMRYELCFYIPEDGILRSHRREILKSILLTDCFFSERQRANIMLSQRNFGRVGGCCIKR